MRFLQTFQLHDFFNTLVSLFVAFVFGTLIGAERQYRQRSAGLRTNVLVSVGAAAFVDLAEHLTGADGAVRVVAYVVSGIGFLGAGAIMKEGLNVRGLNTAATLWASAAVGSCAGADMAGQSVALTVFVRAGPPVLGPPEDIRAGRQHVVAAAGERDRPHSVERAHLRSDLRDQRDHGLQASRRSA